MFPQQTGAEEEDGCGAPGERTVSKSWEKSTSSRPRAPAAPTGVFKHHPPGSQSTGPAAAAGLGGESGRRERAVACLSSAPPTRMKDQGRQATGDRSARSPGGSPSLPRRRGPRACPLRLSWAADMEQDQSRPWSRRPEGQGHCTRTGMSVPFRCCPRTK